jgi:hypothetical protein
MDTTATEEQYFTIRELARRWKLGRHSVHQLIVGEPGVVRVFTGAGVRPRYRVPVDVASRIEQNLFRANRAVVNE